MNAGTKDAAITAITLDKAADQPLHVQLTGQLRELILSGRILPGGRLPASRALAKDLGVSRITVTTSMDQLVAEGYAEGRHGRGLFVVPDLPETLLTSGTPRPGHVFRPLPASRAAVAPFQPAALDGRLFPHEEWSRLLERCWREQGPGGLSDFTPAGHGPLREAIARHLYLWRGLACQPSDVIVTAGGADALQLLVWSLRLSGRKVVLEDPGYDLFHTMLGAANVTVLPQPVDSQGLNPLGLPPASLAIVTPSRHYPLGYSMPLARRLDLLDWAHRHEAFIVEDDFDSEYRYRGAPLPAMMGLGEAGRVIYLGSFSKVFSPALRLGYLVLPPQLTPSFMAMLEARGAMASAVAQPALAHFMASGRFATHIRRMRRIYATRQQALVEAVGKHLHGLLEVEPEAGGMHLTARLSPGLAARMNDVELSGLARRNGLSLRPLSSFCHGKAAMQGVLMGYSGFDETQLDTACRKLARLLQA
ncbi:MAG: PLP-dependent aminotransferase family protein [Anderseniella sp.]|jgi:GntR family transcriptional regulator/MocR family aminotransferase|nr:PLP-dependent aminotransferase family protein [Anderseniella sp.]